MTGFWSEVGKETRSKFIKDIPVALVVLLGVGAGLNSALATIIETGMTINQAYLTILCGYFGTIGVLVAHACWWSVANERTDRSRFITSAICTVGAYIVGVVCLCRLETALWQMFALSALYIVACTMPLLLIGRNNVASWKNWMAVAVVTIMVPTALIFYIGETSHFRTAGPESIAKLDAAYSCTSERYGVLSSQWTSLTENAQTSELQRGTWVCKVHASRGSESSSVPSIAVFNVKAQDVVVGEEFPVLRAFTAASKTYGPCPEVVGVSFLNSC